MFREVTFEVNGELLTPDPSGALWWEAERTLVFADIHFEKGSSYARREVADDRARACGARRR